ncbi:aspartate aminotransferase yhdr-related [Anaeramoeba ignava]|uniref:Aspartate aminotransferase yhdr-related n=1 Tax=Anaeramoeba ignava TaxID=1746090 RepID=A0A9Q0L9F0_ANAIG|nr:aspartate aminotransferase yhdr-related [Anaeramoeba ignava]|eukprot:Anaeramoba_ignava/a483593_80.p1 GENE.a483593_80~~a483593_80.p1  ORF type:complete len:404 (+),score=88.90 a483593_80:22-1233(+)
MSIEKKTSKAITAEIYNAIKGSSLIRKMFEEGARLKKLYGNENVQDLSIGNPTLDPPQIFKENLLKHAKNIPPQGHGYIPNIGLPETQEAIAKMLSNIEKINIPKDNVIVTSGAAGGMNIIFRSILEQDDEVIVLLPFFPEYEWYAKNWRGKVVKVETDEKFHPNIEKIEAAITEKTRAIIINSPNNPSGAVYTQDEINKIGELLRKYSKKHDRPIYMISDSPYMRLCYDGIEPASIFLAYENSFEVGSFSKDMSIPGERMGYVIVNPNCEYSKDLINAFVLCNRILGFVNANRFFQKIIADSLPAIADIKIYDKLRKIIYNGLTESGFECVEPKGAFYIFPRAPKGHDGTSFTQIMAKKNVLIVPGVAFGSPDFFRISYATNESTLRKAIPLFKQALDEIRK